MNGKDVIFTSYSNAELGLKSDKGEFDVVPGDLVSIQHTVTDVVPSSDVMATIGIL